MDKDKRNFVIACQSSGYLIKDIAIAYCKVGYKVTLLTSKKCQDTIAPYVNDYNFQFRHVVSYNKSSAIKRVTTWVASALQMLFLIMIHHKNDQVLYVSNPPFCTLLPLVLGNKFSILIWDVYPDVLVNQKIVSDKNYMVKLWRGINRRVYDRADHVFAISEGMKKCLSQYVSPEQIKVVPLWPDERNIYKVEKNSNKFIKANGLDGKFIVMYSGNLGNTHRMEVLIDVAKQIDDKDIVFVLIGEGGKKEMIESRIEKEQVANVKLLPFQPYESLSYSLSAADIAVVTLDTASSQMSVPSKTFNLMILGIPLMCIASPDSELGNIVHQYNIGGIFNPEDIQKMTQFVIRLKKTKELWTLYSNNSLKASKQFTSENAKKFVG